VPQTNVQKRNCRRHIAKQCFSPLLLLLCTHLQHYCYCYYGQRREEGECEAPRQHDQQRLHTLRDAARVFKLNPDARQCEPACRRREGAGGGGGDTTSCWSFRSPSSTRCCCPRRTARPLRVSNNTTPPPHPPVLQRRRGRSRSLRRTTRL